MENTLKTLQEHIDTLEYPVVYYHNVFSNGGELAVWHDYEFPFDFDELLGEVDANGEWSWNGEKSITDFNRNSITCVKVRNDQDFFEKDVIQYYLFSESSCVSIPDVDENLIKTTAASCGVSEKRIAEELNGFFDFDEAREQAGEDEIETIERAEKAIGKFLN